jgi:photosystem II stability/assembly factor-like uncharacterized protein
MTQYLKSTLLNVFIASAILITLNQHAQSQKPSSVPYIWKSVQMVGGGFVDGIIFHPNAKGVCYCRTDMGGAYRWNDNTKRWEPMLDWLPYEDTNLMGIESIALDPSDPNLVYLACGTYTSPRVPDGAILRSNDRGRTFQRTNVPFKMGGNENGRGNGERMAVDPNNGNIIYLGTRNAGLWKTIDKGVTWNKVDSFPEVREAVSSTSQQSWWNRGAGIVFVVFDPAQKLKSKASSTIYVGVSLMDRNNFFRSTDGGKTWQTVPGQPVQYRPNHCILASDGNMYLTYGTNAGPGRMQNGGVWKFNTRNEVWTEITPDKPDPAKNKSFGYAAVSVDAHNPQVIIVSSYNRYTNGGEDIFRSIDGGQNWKTVFGGGGGGTFDFTLAPYITYSGIHWLFDIEIDPFDSNHAMFTTGYGGHETFNLTDMDAGKPTKWSIMTTGIEETVSLELLSPPKGAQVITAIGDYCGFVHWDLDRPEPKGCFDNPHFSNTNGLACAENKPEIVVRVGVVSHNRGSANIGYSMDFGKTWQSAISMPTPNSKLGHIAVSSDGATWLWTPDKSPVYFTSDHGTTWTQSKGIPENTRIIADRLNPNKFYGISLFEGKLFVSNDKGATFAEHTLNLPGNLPKQGDNRGDSRGGQDRIYATPNKEGDVWLAAFDGLYHSADTGKYFMKLNDVEEIHAFGFGKSASEANYAALYLVGVINGLRGIFRSDDAAQTWVRINDDQHQWGLVLHITGDPKKYGRVYIGTHGRGTLYGDPLESKK